jgi:hypothetical protein
MRRTFEAALAGLLVAAAAGTASADIDSVDVAEGSIGTQITLTGTDFGDKKPKVWLTESVPLKKGPKKIGLKVTANSPTSITVEVTKGPPGNYDLNVRPRVKGAAAFVSNGAFDIRAPQVDGGLAPGAPLQEVLITGSFFGTRKGKIKVNNKPCKVVLWGAGSITVRLHKKLPNGIFDIEFKTRVGKTLVEDAFTVTGSTVGFPKNDTMSAKFGNVGFNTGGEFLAALWNPLIDDLQVTGTASKGGVVTQVVVKVVVDLDGPLPVQITAQQGDGLITYMRTNALKPQDSVVATTENATNWTITISGVADGRVNGTFSGTLKKAAGGDLEVTNGKFTAELVDQTE